MKMLLMVIASLLLFLQTSAQINQMALIEGGTYTPLYGVGEEADAQVLDFYLDINPISYADYEKFVQEHTEWQKTHVKKIFANARYLSNWENNIKAPDNMLDKPITMISWFAAKAYCECQGKRLPTVDEWEFAAMASSTKKDAREDSLYNVSILRSYEQPKTYMKSVGHSQANYWGVKDLHGMVWEWTQDFNSIILTGESRSNGNTDAGLFCAAGAVGAKDMMNYAAFMRYAMRSSLKANYAITTLGFRCAKDVLPQKQMTLK